MKRDLVRLAAFAFALCLSVVASAQSLQVIHGVVAAADGDTLRVASASGQQTTITVPDSVRIALLVPAKLDDIKPGTFIGTAAKPGPNGTLLASEVHILEGALRGTGEGHHPMSRDPGSTMTNATVARVSGAAPQTRSTMTNATVQDVGSGAKGRTLKLAYKGGEQTVFVSDKTPVVVYEVADRSALAPGAHVIVNARRDANGDLVAQRIHVGANGSVPPI
jgi:hypothetical protein